MTPYLALIILVARFDLTTSQGQQRIVLYEGLDGKGRQLEIDGRYAPNLVDENFDNLAQSICATGIWLLYQDEKYNPDGGRDMEHIFARENTCVNLEGLAGAVSSVRYSGEPKEFRSDSFSIYQHEYFQGKEEFTTLKIPNVTLADHKSIIITGNSNWEVFDQPNYQGERVCLEVLEPEMSTPTFIYDILDSNIPYGAIKSVKYGCDPGFRRIVLKAFEETKTSFSPTEQV